MQEVTPIDNLRLSEIVALFAQKLCGHIGEELLELSMVVVYPPNNKQIASGTAVAGREMQVHLRPHAWVSFHAGGWQDAPRELEGFVRY